LFGKTLLAPYLGRFKPLQCWNIFHFITNRKVRRRLMKQKAYKCLFSIWTKTRHKNLYWLAAF